MIKRNITSTFINGYEGKIYLIRFFDDENSIFRYFMCISGMGMVGVQDVVVELEVWDLD